MMSVPGDIPQLTLLAEAQDKIFEDYIALLEKKAQNLSPGVIPSINIPDIIFDELKRCRLHSSLSRFPEGVSLKIGLNFGEQFSAHLQSLKLLLKSQHEKIYHLDIYPNGQLPNPQNIKCLLESLADTNLSLDLSASNIPSWSFQEISDLLQYIQDKIPLSRLSLWAVDQFNEVAKTWDEKQKQEFIKINFLAEIRRDSHYPVPLPFLASFDQYREYFIRLIQHDPNKFFDRINAWLKNLKVLLPAGDFRTLEGEVKHEWYKKLDYFALDIAFYINKVSLLQELITCRSSTLRIYEFIIKLEDLNEDDILKIQDFFKGIGLSTDHLTIHCNFEKKDQAEKLVLLLKHLETAPIKKSLAILSHNHDKLAFETLCEITRLICQLTWVKQLRFSQAGIVDHLSEDKLLTWCDSLSGQKIQEFEIYSYGLETRHPDFLRTLFNKLKRSLPKLEHVSFWQSWGIQWEEIFREKDRDYRLACARIYTDIHLFGNGNNNPDKPCYGILDQTDTFNLLKEYIENSASDKALNRIRYWAGQFEFTYEQRKWLLQNIIPGLGIDDDISVIPFKLSEKDRLEALVLWAEKVGAYQLINIKTGFDLLDSDTAAKDFLDPWAFLIDRLDEKPLNYTLDVNELEFDDLKETIQSQLIPHLKSAADKHFSNTPFYQLGWNKIINFNIKEGEVHDLEKWLNLIQWYTWFMASLLLYSKDALNLREIADVFKEIVDFAHPITRYQAGKLLLEVITCPHVNESYHKLISALQPKQKNSEKSQLERRRVYRTMTLIPALFLNKILSEDSPDQVLKDKDLKEKEGKEGKEDQERKVNKETTTALAMDILKQLPNDFANGNKARAFVSALQALSQTKELSSHKKIVLLKQLIVPDTKRKTIEEALKGYFYRLKIKSKTSKITAGELQNQLEPLLEQDLQRVLEKLPKLYKEIFETQKLNAILDFSQIDINALSRSLISGFIEVFHDQETRRQVANCYLIQGLSLLTELKTLAETTSSEYRKAINVALKNLFQLEDSHLECYPLIFGGKRNESALFTYLSKIRSLNELERTSQELRYRDLLCSILSQGSKAFYENRYNPAVNPHLDRIFTLRPDLQNLWSQNIKIDFNDFVREHNIINLSTEMDYVKFLNNKIFLNRHFKPEDCPILEKYLKESDIKLKSEHKRYLEEKLKEDEEYLASLQSQKPSPQYLKLKLQLELIMLIETPQSDRKTQLKCIRAAIRCIRSLSMFYEFVNDLKSLQRKLLSSSRSLDLDKTKGWKIVFTDDFWDLFMAGTDVEGSCQRVDGDPALNKCLLSYVQDGKNKMLAIQDETGKTIARCIVRLLLDEKENKPILFMEEIYPFTASSQQKKALEKLASLLAEDFRLVLVSSEITENSRKYGNTVVSLHGFGPEYVDALHFASNEGIFSIPTSQILHSPYAGYTDKLTEKLEEVLKQNQNPPGYSSRISSLVLDYLDVASEDHSDRVLHFHWRLARDTRREVGSDPKSAARKMSG